MGNKKYVFFDHIKYSAADFMSRMADFFGTGVVNPSTDFSLSYPATPSMTINVTGVGTAWSLGGRSYYDGVTPIPLAFAANTSGYPRIDLVEVGPISSPNITLGVNQDLSQIIIKQGTPAASPVQPTPDTGYTPLYAVAVASGATALTSANVTDLRSRVPFWGFDIVAKLASFLPIAGGTVTGAIVMSGAAINEAYVNMASTATMNIGAAAANTINVTGTNNITAFDVVQAGTKRRLLFGGGLTITYNSTSMKLPGNQNLSINAGDSAEFTSLGGGNWQCTDYQHYAGYLPLLGGTMTGPIVLSGDPTANMHPVTKQYGAANYAPIASPALTGTPTAPTAAVGTNTTQIATTAFVKTAGEQFGGIKSVSTTATLDGTYAGQLTVCSGTSYTVTLPSASAYPAGNTLTFLCVASGTITVGRAGTDTITVNNGSAVNSLALGSGDTLTLVSNGTNGWDAVAGSAQLGSAAAFGASLASNGFQKLPSGLIIQWGTASIATAFANYSLPIAFPTANLCAIAISTGASDTTTNVIMSATGNTLSSIRMAISITNGPAQYFAIGY